MSEDSLLRAVSRLARYNRGANARLYAACADLSDAERRQPRKAFFTSIHGTLNHIMVGDRIWLSRFRGAAMPSTNLDAILFDAFDALRVERQLLDDDIVAFADAVTPGFLNGMLHYVSNAGVASADPAAVLILHFFNHQTHHRGQVHDMLTQTGIPTPVLDMHVILRDDPLPPPLALT